MELRGMWLSASMFAVLATLAHSFECPAECSCAARLREQEYECERPAGRLLLRTVVNEYVKVTCQDGGLLSSELPVINVAQNATLPSVSLSGCVLDEPLANMLAVFAASGVDAVTLQDTRGELKHEYLRGVEGITKLRMFDAAGQHSVPYSVLSSLPSLQEFRLVGGRAALALPPGGFRVSPSLRFLELGNDHIQDLPPGGFLGLQHLKGLSLWGNRIENVTAESFRGLESVEKLELSRNRLRRLPPKVFQFARRLKSVKLFANPLQEIATDAFAGLPQLVEIIAFDNLVPLSLRPGSLANLTITTLKLTNCKISELPADVFRNSTQLLTLQLTTNNIRRLPPRLFQDQRQLETLELGGNKLRELTPGVFWGMRRLKKLILDGNDIEVLPGQLFSGLTSLTHVSICKNRLKSIATDAFLGAAAVRVLRLDDNLLELDSHHDRHTTPPPHNISHSTSDASNLSHSTSDASNLSHSTSDASNLSHSTSDASNLSHSTSDASKSTSDASVIRYTIEASNLPSSTTDKSSLNVDVFNMTSINITSNISALDVSNSTNLNDESDFPDFTFGIPSSNSTSIKSHSSNIKRRDVSVPSNTTREDQSPASNWPSADYEYEWYVPIGQYSPFMSLVTLEELRLANNRVDRIYYDWQYLMTNLKVLDLSGNDVTEIQSLQFLSHDIVVNLSNNKISSVQLSLPPPGYPSDPTVGHTGGTVLLDGNPLDCDCHIYPLLLRIRGLLPMMTPEPKIQIGDARCARPSMLANKLVRNLPASAVTCPATCPTDCTCQVRPSTSHLEVNCTTLPINLTKPVEAKATELKLQVLPNSLMDLPDTVTVLKLDNIGLNEAPNSVPSTLRALDLSNNELTRVPITLLEANLSLHLAGNPFICDCSSDDFVFALRQSLVLNKIVDGDNVTCVDGQSPLSIDVTRLCSVRKAALLGGTLAALGAVIAIAAALTYRYSLEIKVFMYSREWLRWMIREDDVDRDKKYDAFVSYSHKDERFVVEKIVYELENGPRPFKLCVHYRDWILGEWIPAQIANSVEQSRRTIIVLSKHFLESVWGTLEFRVAHIRAQKERRTRLVIILLDDAPPEDTLDPELRSYLSTNTYVKWGDPWFWEKLRYALAGYRVDEKAEKRARSLGEKIAKSGFHKKLATHGGVVGNKDEKVASDKNRAFSTAA